MSRIFSMSPGLYPGGFLCAAKQERINEANGQVARFNSLYEEYINFPEVTRQRMFYEAMEDVLPGLKVIIQTNDGDMTTMLPLESFFDMTTVTN